MERKQINEMDLEQVVGGTIIFSGDHQTCGYFCNDQYHVNDFDAAVDYILSNKGKMSEKEMLKRMLSAGIISNL